MLFAFHCPLCFYEVKELISGRRICMIGEFVVGFLPRIFCCKNISVDLFSLFWLKYVRSCIFDGSKFSFSSSALFILIVGYCYTFVEEDDLTWLSRESSVCCISLNFWFKRYGDELFVQIWRNWKLVANSIFKDHAIFFFKIIDIHVSSWNSGNSVDGYE